MSAHGQRLHTPRRAPRLVPALALSLWGSCSSPDAVTNTASDPRPDLTMPVPDLATPIVPPAVGDPLPRGAVSFYNSKSCPTGWEPLVMAQGRTLLPSADKDPAGSDPAVGEPLTDGEDRQHSHRVSASINLPTVSYVGIAGEANHGLGRGGVNPMTITTGKASAGLPYVQLLVCQKTSEPVASRRTIPPGLLLFFLLPECPDGWARAGASQGRFLVGLPDSGTPGQSFGGKPLGVSDKPGHRHGVMGTIKTLPHGIALITGGGASGYAKDDTHGYQANTDDESPAMPYLKLLQCQKS